MISKFRACHKCYKFMPYFVYQKTLKVYVNLNKKLFLVLFLACFCKGVKLQA